MKPHPDKLRLARELATGTIHRRDCRLAEGACEDCSGLEHSEPSSWCVCVASLACELVGRYFGDTGPYSPAIERDRVELASWLTDIAESFELVFKRDGAIREPAPALAVIDGGAPHPIHRRDDDETPR